MKAYQLFFFAIDVLQPILGIIFFFAGVDVGLYICGAYGILFALQRIPKGDIGPIIATACAALLALIFPINGYNFWQTASLLICAYNAWIVAKGIILLRKLKNM